MGLELSTPTRLYFLRRGKIMKIVKKQRPIAYILFSLIIVIGIVLDQITKLVAVRFLEPVGDVPIIKNIFHFTYLTNDGAAWGMFDDHPWIFMTASIIAIIGMSFYIYLGHAESLFTGASMATIVSGGIGNMIDRTTTGEVVDFINTCFVRYPTSLEDLFVFKNWATFPVFNVADCFVCIGAGMLIFSLLLDIVKESRQKKNAEDTEGAQGEDNAQGEG